MQSGGIITARILAAHCLVFALAAPVGAQDRGGLQASLDFAQGLTFSDQDNQSFAQTDFGFSLTSETRTQTFAFQIGARLEAFRNGSDTVELADPNLALSYSLENRQNALELSFGVTQADADSLVQDLDAATGFLVLDEGKRRTSNAALSYAFGREARFGGTLNLGVQDTAFKDTTSTQLLDTRTHDASLALRFEIDRRITATLGYDIAQTDRVGGNDTTRERLTASANLDVTQTLTANLSLGYTQIETKFGGSTSNSDGLTYGANLTNARPNGAISFDFSSSISEAGRRTTATVGRTLETRSGAFSATLGVTDSDSTDLRPIASLSYQEELARGTLNVGLNQAFSSNVDGLDTLNSQFTAGWVQDLTPRSRFQSNISYQTSEVIGIDESTSRLDLGLTFSQDLTADWALTTRFVHSRFDGTGQLRREENDLFIGLATNLAWRP